MKMSIAEIKKIIEQKKSERSLWDTLYQDIGDYIFTRKSSTIIKRTQGEDLQVNLFDNTGPRSLELFAGMMMSILMSVEEQWFEHSSGDVEVDQKDYIKKYLQMVTRAVHNMFANSNFYTEAHEMLLDLGGFGTNIFGIEEDEEDVVRYFSKFIGEGYLGEDARGKVDELYMEYEYTARQIQKEYPDAKLPETVLKAIEKNDEKKFKVAVCIYPVDRKTKSANKKGHTYYSHHVMCDEKAELRLGGFTSFPYATPRFSKATGETYGRSPGMTALPEVKVLNKMVEITLIGAEKVIDPPLQAPDDGFITQVNTFPAALSFYRAGSQDRIEPIFNDARIDFGIQIIEQKQAQVRSAFFLDQMMPQQKQGNPVTATEYSHQAENGMRFMGPFLSRMKVEFLQRVVDRTTEIAFKRGLLKAEDIPQELRGKNFTVKYTSFVARAQRAGTLQNMMRWFAMIEPVVNADPTAKAYINSGGTIRTAANLLGIPVEMINPEKEVQAMRQQMMQQQQQMQAAEQQNQQMDTVAKAGQASKAVQG